MKLGFIGQGWVGGNIADEFNERLGWDNQIIRYSLEEPFCRNIDELLECEYVFVCVPTATTKYGHDISNVRNVLSLLFPETIVIIKSTIKPGTTIKLQDEFPYLVIIHSPEFLTEANVVMDVKYPKRNIIGIPYEKEPWLSAAQDVINLLPGAPYNLITHSTNAELIKYAGNAYLLTKVVFTNMLYDLVKAYGANWNEVRDGWTADYRIGESHTKVFDKEGKRGAAGHCLLKDFEVYRSLFNQADMQADILRQIASLNIGYLISTNKDLDLIKEIYGFEYNPITKELENIT